MLIVQRRRAAAYDPDAQAYITAVEAADTQALEVGVKDAINAFVVGCKADGIWSAIKASCIMAGARTLAGALVPLVGAAPTNFNFVAGDYNRKTGLVGNGSTKYLECNRNNNADPQNNQHFSVYCSSKATNGIFPVVIASAAFSQAGWSSIFQRRLERWEATSQGSTIAIQGANESAPAFLAVSRSISTSASFRGPSFTVSGGGNSFAPIATPWYVYRDVTGNFSNARLAFYSIGESLDLALLDARVTTLINAIAAAIP